MTAYRKPGLLGAAFVLLFLAQVAPDAPLDLAFPGEAQAIVGRPLTPVSVAGVARRTAVRTTAVVETTTAVAVSEANAQAAEAQQQAAVAQQQAAAAQQPAATPSGQALPLGTVVAALPGGCSQMTAGGIEYYQCGANYYRAVFQGNNLVYVTAKP